MHKEPKSFRKKILFKIAKLLFIFIGIPFLLLSITFIYQIKTMLDLQNEKTYCINISKGEKIKKIETIEEGYRDYNHASKRNVWVAGIKSQQDYIERQSWKIKYIDTSKEKMTLNLKGKEVEAEAIYYIDFTKLPRYEEGKIDFFDHTLGDFYISFYKEKGKYVACYHYSGQWSRLTLLKEEEFVKESYIEDKDMGRDFYIWVRGIKDYKEYMDRQAWIIQFADYNPQKLTFNLDEQKISPEVVYHLDYGEQLEDYEEDDEDDEYDEYENDIKYYPIISFYKEKGQDTYMACYCFGYQD